MSPQLAFSSAISVMVMAAFALSAPAAAGAASLARPAAVQAANGGR